MSETKERRQTERQLAGGTASVSFGQEPLQCRIIDFSETGAQIRIDGRRATRNFVGKRASLVRNGSSSGSHALEARVVWVRPAVNGVYLGLEILKPDRKVETSASGE
ncbi:MAG: PilZ domain-containing protein [Candidatus Binatia bacterium]